MSYHLGDFALETTVYAKFTTVTTTGAPTQLAGSPVVSVYENDDNTQITAGVTLNVDEDGLTGLNQLVIVATAANGYEAGKFYTAVITTGTVGGTSVVGYCVASFTIQATSALRPTTAGRTLDVSAGGEAGVDWANVGSPTTALNLSGTNIDVDQIVASVSGAVGSVTGAVGSVTGAVGSVAAGGIANASFAANALSASKIDPDVTTELQAGLSTAAEVAKIPKSDGTATWNATALASLQAEATDALNAYDPPTKTELDSAVSPLATTTELAKVPKSDGTSTWNATALASLQAEATDALNAYDPPTKAELDSAVSPLATAAALTTVEGKVDTVDTVVDAIKAKTDSLAFTSPGFVDANAMKLNTTTITGNGTSGTPWGPA